MNDDAVIFLNLAYFEFEAHVTAQINTNNTLDPKSKTTFWYYYLFSREIRCHKSFFFFWCQRKISHKSKITGAVNLKVSVSEKSKTGDCVVCVSVSRKVKRLNILDAEYGLSSSLMDSSSWMVALYQKVSPLFSWKKENKSLLRQSLANRKFFTTFHSVCMFIHFDVFIQCVCTWWRSIFVNKFFQRFYISLSNWLLQPFFLHKFLCLFIW